jgi:outer membrane protein assembly factor BamB
MSYREASASHPLVAVYDSEAYGIDRRSGARLWSYETQGGVAHFTLAHGRVYLFDERCRLHCLDAASGALVGVVQIDEGRRLRAGNLIADDEFLYVTTAQAVVAVNTQGQIAWRCEAGPALGYTRPGLGLPGNVAQKDYQP